MAITTAKVLNWVPSAATGTSVTPNASAWVNSSWVQMIASTSGAIQIESLAIHPGVDNVEFEVDIGTGGAGSEVVLATIRGATNTSAVAGGMDDSSPKFGIIIDAIPNGTRVSVRMRKQGGDATAWTFALGYQSATDTTNTTTNGQLTSPSAATGVSVTPSNTGWANSSYTQITASFANAIWLTGLMVTPGVTSVEAEFDIATGGAGSEIVVTTFRAVIGSNQGNNFVSLAHPLQIAASTRIAIRMRKSGISTIAWDFAIMYYKQQAAAAVTANQSFKTLLGVGNI